MKKYEPFDYDEYHDKLDWQDVALLVTVAIAVAIIVVEYII